ncbi:MAG TPA: glycosyl hydrolase, partial [Opitutaceae bacterium]|nr:glycosyl hydrolase [Opitutaceae bacterium]
MNSPRFLRSAPLALAALLGLGASPYAGADLQSGFEQPPASAAPRTWWHWISGNISSQGISADLAAMKAIGLGGAQVFTVDQSDVKGPVVFMSPQWRALVKQAITESDRLGLELSIEDGEGWSESGGPWVTPAQSMQKVVWAEAYVHGGGRVPLAIPQPLTIRGYYQDIAVFAFPTLRGDGSLAGAR